MDGNELAVRLRDIPATSDAMLIAITGFGQELDRYNTRAAGFNRHHVTPLDLGRLMGVLAELQ